MKKTIFLTAILSLFFAVISYGQVMRLAPKDGAKVVFSSADSASFYQRVYFDVPEMVNTDTLQLLVYLYSADGAVHVKLSSAYAIRLVPLKDKVTRFGTKADTYFKLSPDTTILSADYSTEGMTAFMITGAAKDTTENGSVGLKIWPDAIAIGVSGVASNRADTDIFLKLVGRYSEY